MILCFALLRSRGSVESMSVGTLIEESRLAARQVELKLGYGT